MKGSNGARAGWLGLSAILMAFIIFQLAENAPLAPEVTAAPIEAPSATADDVSLVNVVSPSPDLLDDIIDRPLFSNSRQPFQSPAADKPLVSRDEEQRLSLLLVGTMLTGSSRIALLKHPSEGLLRLRQGRRLDGWEIVKIDHNMIEFRRGDEIEVLKLSVDVTAAESRSQQQQAPSPQDKLNGILEQNTATQPHHANQKSLDSD